MTLYLLKVHLQTYVYWTVHHLDSWIKRDQVDVTCFIISLFNAQHVSGVNTSILRSLRLICWFVSWVVLLWFDVCWWCGIRMQASACIRIPHLQTSLSILIIQKCQILSCDTLVAKWAICRIINYSEHIFQKRFQKSLPFFLPA